MTKRAVEKVFLHLGWFLMGAAYFLWMWIIGRLVWPGPPSDIRSSESAGDWLGYNIGTMIVGRIGFWVAGLVTVVLLSWVLSGQVVSRSRTGLAYALACSGIVLFVLGTPAFDRAVFWQGWFH